MIKVMTKTSIKKTPVGQRTLSRPKVIQCPTYFSKSDIEKFNQGENDWLYQKLGAHPMHNKETLGTYFAVWAPHADSVSVIGDFNNWVHSAHKLIRRHDHSGLWEGFVAGAKKADRYKYHICAHSKNFSKDKIDPFAFYSEVPPKTASVIWDLTYKWNDQEWMDQRGQRHKGDKPLSIYEVHPGSWRRHEQDNNKFFTYRQMADCLVDYVKKMGFTHVELMPMMEHPFYGSWGYQSLGFFSPTSRYGKPQDLMYLIDCFHQNNIGVILDWVPSHFPCDDHGLGQYDGTNLFEYDDLHPDWNSHVFNNGRNEVIQFLVSSALFWMDQYHIDGLRVDAVASMLYLDYSRGHGQWQPNFFGGHENLESIAFLRRLNEKIHEKFSDCLMIAEESTAWRGVSSPSKEGGLGFDMKWNMGWMHDTLKFFCLDPRSRSKSINKLTHCLYYAFSENFILSLSHDEVVHEKSSLLAKMPGDDWEKFNSLKCLYGFMYAHPGKKLLFMGSEIGPWNEWNHDVQLDWYLLQYGRHQGIQNWVRDLNAVYQSQPALHDQDFSAAGFEWMDLGDSNRGVISFVRKSMSGQMVLIILNFNLRRTSYRVGIPVSKIWKEILNSDDKEYSGSGGGLVGQVMVEAKPCHGRGQSLWMNLAPLSVVFLKLQDKD